MKSTSSTFHYGRMAGLGGLLAALALAVVFVALSSAGAQAQYSRSSGGYFTIADKHSEVAVEQEIEGDPIDVSAYSALVLNLGIEAANLDTGKYVQLVIQSANHPEARDWQDVATLTFTEGTDTAPKSGYYTVDIDDAEPLARYVRWTLEFETATTSQSVVLRASAVGHQ